MKRTVLMLVVVPLFAIADEKAKPEAAKAKPEAAKAEMKKMEPPKPFAELDALKPLAGMWNCDGKAPESPMGPAHTFKSTLNQKWDLANFWIWQEYHSLKSKENPMAFGAKGWMGWDAANKHYVWAGVDDMGGWISLTSTGWTGDKMEFNGDGQMMAMKSKAKFTVTKGKTPNELMMESTMQNEKGEWMPPTSETCKKK